MRQASENWSSSFPNRLKKSLINWMPTCLYTTNAREFLFSNSRISFKRFSKFPSFIKTKFKVSLIKPPYFTKMVIYFHIEHLGVFKLTMGDFWNPIAILPNGSVELRKIENEKRLGCKLCQKEFSKLCWNLTRAGTRGSELLISSSFDSHHEIKNHRTFWWSLHPIQVSTNKCAVRVRIVRIYRKRDKFTTPNCQWSLRGKSKNSNVDLVVHSITAIGYDSYRMS